MSTYELAKESDQNSVKGIMRAWVEGADIGVVDDFAYGDTDCRADQLAWDVEDEAFGGDLVAALFVEEYAQSDSGVEVATCEGGEEDACGVKRD